MGRRSDHSRPQIHEMILNAAAAIIEEDGLRGLSMRHVAARIGYSVGTIYNLFRNLDDLVVQLNGRTLDDLYEALSATPKGDSVAASLDGLATTYLEFTHRHANRWNALFEHQLPAGVLLPEWYDQKIKRLLALVEYALAPVFGPHQARDRLRAARVLWCGLHGIGSLADSGKLGLVTDQSVADMSRSFVETYLMGLAAERPDRTSLGPA